MSFDGDDFDGPGYDEDYDPSDDIFAGTAIERDDLDDESPHDDNDNAEVTGGEEEEGEDVDEGWEGRDRHDHRHEAMEATLD